MAEDRRTTNAAPTAVALARDIRKKHPSLFRNKEVNSTYAAFVASLNKVSNSQEAVDNEGEYITASEESPASVWNEGRGEDVPTGTKDAEIRRLKAEVSRLRQKYEPLHGPSLHGIGRRAASRIGDQEERKGSETTPAQELRLLHEQEKAAQARLRDARNAKQAALEKAQGVMGKQLAEEMAGRVQKGYDENPDNAAPEGELEKELLDAHIAEVAATNEADRAYRELAEARETWSHPWHMAGRAERSVLQSWDFIQPFVAALRQWHGQWPPYDHDDNEQPEGEAKEAKEEEGDSAWRQQVRELMAKPLPTPEDVERATDIIEALQRAVQRRDDDIQEAQRHYDGLCKQGEKLLGDAMLKEFEESAKKAEGARDARPLVQQLHHAHNSIEAAKASHEAAVRELREREGSLNGVAVVLERLVKSAEALKRAYPAVLASVIERCHREAAPLWPTLSTAVGTLAGHAQQVWSAQMHPTDPRIVASGSQDNTLRLWKQEGKDGNNVPQWKVLATLPGNSTQVYCVAWHPRGSAIASGGADHKLLLWSGGDIKSEVATWTCQATLTGHSNYIASVKWRPDGDSVATASTDKTVRIWTRQAGSTGFGTDSWTCAKVLEFGSFQAYSLDWHPGGRMLLVGLQNKTIQVWSQDEGDTNHDTWQRVAQLTEHTSHVYTVRWHPSGNAFVSGSNDGTLRVWQRANDTGFDQWVCEAVLTDHLQHWLQSVDWSPDGNALVDSSKSSTARLWMRPIGSKAFNRWDKIRELQGHGGQINGVHWHPVSNDIVTCSNDKMVKVWQCPLPFHSLVQTTQRALQEAFEGPFTTAACGLIGEDRVLFSSLLHLSLCLVVFFGQMSTAMMVKRAS